MHESWYEYLLPFLCSEEGDVIFEYLKEDNKRYNIFPESNKIFNAFKVPFKDVKVVILGQDPYYTKGVATGYAFGVNKDFRIAPSLHNIIKEVKRTEGDKEFDKTLKSWVDQGVLLINTAFTVREGQPNSHSKIWNSFINFVFSTLNYNKSNLVYLLWGNHAKGYKKLIDENNHILESSHPSPLAKGFVGNNHFKLTNEILSKNDKRKIKWI